MSSPELQQPSKGQRQIAFSFSFLLVRAAQRVHVLLNRLHLHCALNSAPAPLPRFVEKHPAYWG
jgi:hypothetical protein